MPYIQPFFFIGKSLGIDLPVASGAIYYIGGEIGSLSNVQSLAYLNLPLNNNIVDRSSFGGQPNLYLGSNSSINSYSLITALSKLDIFSYLSVLANSAIDATLKLQYNYNDIRSNGLLSGFSHIRSNISSYQNIYSQFGGQCTINYRLSNATFSQSYVIEKIFVDDDTVYGTIVYAQSSVIVLDPEIRNSALEDEVFITPVLNAILNISVGSLADFAPVISSNVLSNEISVAQNMRFDENGVFIITEIQEDVERN